MMTKHTVKENAALQNSSAAKPRESNLELFRIITMLLIIAHHYVVNSGLLNADSPIANAPVSGKSMFLLLFGAWGKIGINCFVMITGYFMCKSQITAKKFAKLFFEVLFYRLGIYLIFLISGYTGFSVRDFIKAALPVTSIEQNFTGCFIVFFLFIPFLNMLVSQLSERQHIRLLLLCFFTYVFFGTLRGGPFGISMNYVSWFSVLYFTASYIRLYPKKCFDSVKFSGLMLLISMLLSAASVVVSAYAGAKINQFIPYYFVTDSNTFLAVLTGVSAFLFFKNLKIPYNQFINTVAASTFGVLLIHANSNTMRQWLWNDLLDCVGHYQSSLMPLYAIGCVLGIFAVCAVIDVLRIRLLEKPFFKWWDQHWDGVMLKFQKKEQALFQKFNIES